MKAVGVIVEYNPFHHGHAYHVKKAKEITGAEIVIAAMSGNFLQRGEPALVSKWTRTEMALYGGIDLVFELALFLCRSKSRYICKRSCLIIKCSWLRLYLLWQ